MRDTDQVLEDALRRLQLGWCQGNLAEDAEGQPCDPSHQAATAWCCVGAIEAATDDEVLATKALYRVAFAAGCADDDWEVGITAAVMRWQDSTKRSVEDVLLAVKQALG